MTRPVKSSGMSDVKSGAIVEKDPLGNVTALDTKNLPHRLGARRRRRRRAHRRPGRPARRSGWSGRRHRGRSGGGHLGRGGRRHRRRATGTLADLTNWGLKADYLDTAATYLLPGKTAVVAEVEEGSTEPIDAAVAHGGIVYREAITV